MIRFFDFFLSVIGIIILAPLFLIIIIIIKVSSKGPIFYKQTRVGKSNINFKIWKFRTMKIGSDVNGLLTIGNRDVRITRIGFYLRKYKLDELPQLLNVILGEMSIVGPRPEVRKYVDMYTLEQMKVLSVKPGITDWASIIYKDENQILGKSVNPELDYVQLILPDKMRYNLIFINNQTLFEYFKIIIFTFLKLFKTNINYHN